MIKERGEWKTVDWKAALEFVARGLKGVTDRHGGAALGMLVSPHSTLEEMALAARLARALGSDNIDFRLRQTDFRGDGRGAGIPWLGLPIADIDALRRVLVVGSFLRKDHPLVAQRLRQAARKGAQISVLQSVADDSRMPIAHSFIAAPSLLPRALAEIVVAAALGAGKPVPAALAGIEPTAAAQVIAASLVSGEQKAVLLGNYAEQHAEASQLLALAQALADIAGATLGCLAEAANSVGGYIAGALPDPAGGNGLNARAMLADARKAYVLFGAEPEFDCANPVAARAALDKSDFAVVLSPFKHGVPYADALLPISPSTETAGTFVNCEGRAQQFNGVVKPLGETRPGVEGVARAGIDARRARVRFRFDRRRPCLVAGDSGDRGEACQRNDGRHCDPGRRRGRDRTRRRRADPLRRPARAARAIAAGNRRREAAAGADERAHAGADRRNRRRAGQDPAGQWRGGAERGRRSARVPAGIVRIAAAHPSTCGLEGLSGSISVERA